MSEADPLLRRLERRSLAVCGSMAALVWAVSGGRLEPALGIVGGGALVAISYRGVKDGVDALTGAAGGGRGGMARVFALVKFFTRYAILSAAAYVIMVRLSLPPVAVIAGASSMVVAAALEALGPRRRSNDHIDTDNPPSL